MLGDEATSGPIGTLECFPNANADAGADERSGNQQEAALPGGKWAGVAMGHEWRAARFMVVITVIIRGVRGKIFAITDLIFGAHAVGFALLDEPRFLAHLGIGLAALTVDRNL